MQQQLHLAARARRSRRGVRMKVLMSSRSPIVRERPAEASHVAATAGTPECVPARRRSMPHRERTAVSSRCDWSSRVLMREIGQPATRSFFDRPHTTCGARQSRSRCEHPPSGERDQRVWLRVIGRRSARRAHSKAIRAANRGARRSPLQQHVREM